MTDTTLLAFRAEVQWVDTWVDETAVMVAAQVRHGAAVNSNPDRPTVASARGHLVLAQTLTDDRRGRRYRCRFTNSGTVLWYGWMQEPRHVAAATPQTRWRLAGVLEEYLQREVAVNEAASTTQDTVEDDTLWSALVGAAATHGELESRALLELNYAGRCGRFVSQLSAVAGAEAVERADGTLHFAGYVLDSAPAAPLVLPTSTIIHTVESVDRADRIRNYIRTKRAATPEESLVTWPLTVHQEATADNTPRAADADIEFTGTLTVPTDGATYTDFAVDIGSAYADVMAGLGYGVNKIADWGDDNDDDVIAEVSLPDDEMPTVTVDEDEGVLTVTVTFAAGVPSNSSVTWTITYTYAFLSGSVGAVLEYEDDAEGPLNQLADFWHPPGDEYVIGTANRASTNPQVREKFVLPLLGLGCHTIVRATRNESAPILDVVLTNTASVAHWGRREQELAPWLSATNDLQAQVDALAGLRHEHIVTLPLHQPSLAAQDAVNAVDAGSYLALNIVDAAQNIDVHEHVLVRSRELRYSVRAGPQVRLRCLELGVVPAATTRAYSSGYSSGYS